VFRAASGACDLAGFGRARSKYLEALSAAIDRAARGGRSSEDFHEALLQEESAVFRAPVPQCEKPVPVPVAAPPIAAPATLADDPYGAEWLVTESDWSGRWIRRGSTQTFDGVWSRGDERVSGALEIDIQGDRVTIERRNASDGNSCRYEGILSGNRVSGTRQCAEGGGQWSATIRQVSADAVGPLTKAAIKRLASARSSAIRCYEDEVLQEIAALEELVEQARRLLREAEQGDRSVAFIRAARLEYDGVVRNLVLAQGYDLESCGTTPLRISRALTQRLEEIVAADSRGWRTNKYVPGSMRNGHVIADGTDPDTFVARGEYTYNTNHTGWVIVRFADGQVECLQYHDIGENCRAPH
jgi:hypothetical protein